MIVMRVVVFLKLHFVIVRVSAVRQMDDGFEVVRLRNVARGFEIFTFRSKNESLSRAVRPHRFNFDMVAAGRGTRPLLFIVEMQPEAWRHAGFKDGDFNETVAGVHEQAVAWSMLHFVVIV